MEKFPTNTPTKKAENAPLSETEELYDHEAAEIDRKILRTDETLTDLEQHEPLLHSLFETELRRAGVADPAERMSDTYIPLEDIQVVASPGKKFVGQFDFQGIIRLDGVAMEDNAGYITDKIMGKSDEYLSLLQSQQHLSERNSPFIIPNILAVRRFLALKKQFEAKAQDVEEASYLMSVISTTVHEELHALTYEPKYSAVKQDEHGFIASRKIGVQDNTTQNRADTHFGTIRDERYRGVNEGITELYAQKISRDFLRQAMPGDLNSSDIDAFCELYEYFAYSKERWVTEQLITMIATTAEVPEEIVQDAFFSAYLNNENVLPTETLEMLTAVLHDRKHEDVESILLKLQVCLGANSIQNDSDIHRITAEFIDMLPEEKRDTIKDKFGELFLKYSFNKKLYDEVLEND